MEFVSAREGFAVMTAAETRAFLGLPAADADHDDGALAGCPSFVLGNGNVRYLREQVITWAAVGGAAPRSKQRGRSRALFSREDA